MYKRLVVIGAGIIGSHCALQLRQRFPESRITVIDRDPFSYNGASSGNMGGFATCEVQPLATAANIFKALGWMLNPLAPFALRPASIPSLLPWISGFLKAAVTPGHVAHVVKAQQSLMSRAHAAHLGVIGDLPLANLISAEGALVLYKRPKRLQSDWDGRWRLFRECGESCERLGVDELRARLPGLSAAIKHAIHVPEICYWTSPASLLRGLHGLLLDRNVEIKTAEVVTVQRGNNLARRLVLADGESVEFDHLTIAAGAWSKALCTEVGDYVPLDSERGYATTIPESNTSIRNLLLFPDDEFVATPMSEGLRLGGTVELAGLDVPPNYRRTDLLAKTIVDYFPDIDTTVRDEWMGHRPSTPDGLPVISMSPSLNNVCYAFGHGHVGVTQSAITGILLAQLANGERPDVDVEPFSIRRFS